MTGDTAQYGADQITVLEGLEAVRRRPAMYIGDTSERGLHHLLWEVVDNSVDEAMAGACSEIIVTLHSDHSVTVEDNGRGIPTDTHHQTGTSALEVVLTRLHAGGKFENKAYRISGGLHGVGVSVVNALSERLIATVYREGRITRQEFERGTPVSPPKVIGKTDRRGTTITFKPDFEIFDTLVFHYETVSNHLRELAYLNSGLRIVLKSEREGDPPEQVFQYSEGIVQLVRVLNESNKPIHEPPIYFAGESDGVMLEIAMQYIEEAREHILSYANNIRTVEGGTHLEGFKLAITNAIKQYGKTADLLKEKDLAVTGEDVREGLSAVVSVRIPNPQFEGQTKTKLGNRAVKSVVQTFLTRALYDYLDQNPPVGRAIIHRALLAARVRTAARRAAEIERKSALGFVGGLPGKLVDCTSRDPRECELFVVEGDSAGGSAKSARDARTQAILPIRGKILNVEKASLHKMLENEEIRALITAIGTSYMDHFDISKLRYHKIIIMTDADVDGAHIRILLLTFFYRFMSQLIENGHVYIALAPLFRLRKGKTDRYVFTEEERDRLLKGEMKAAVVTRFKGLGEMDKDPLWETTMNPETRTLLKVTVREAERADQLLQQLMGKDAEQRRIFLQENARFAQNLDI
ncbi:MAG: DNA topoisomerase (ATP-hydrolyzing) subunit B [bacterium JZ-2024 1]